MSNATVKLTGSGAFQDIGTISTSTSGLANNMQSVNQILDVGLRNTSNIKDSFLRVSDLTGLGLATLNGNQLTVADLTSSSSISVNGTSGVNALVFSGATVSVSDGVATITITGSGGGTGTVTSVGITSTTLTVSGTVTSSGNLTVNLSSTQVSDLGLAATALQPVTGIAGSYTNANITLNSSGQITAAANGSGGGGAVGLPATIPNLIYWLPADQLTAAMDSGTSAPVLPNYVPGNSRDYYVRGGTAEPTYAGTKLNSLGTLTFAGGERYIAPIAQAPYTTYGGPILSQATVFAVINTAAAHSSTYGYSVVAGSTDALEFRIDNNGHPSFSNSVSNIVGTGTLSDGTWYQVNATYAASSGAYAFRVARAAAGSGTSSLTINKGSNAVFFYNDGSPNLDFVGSVAELIIYNRVLTSAEITAIETYLNTKWGV